MKTEEKSVTMSSTESKPVIKKVVMVGNGREGLNVTYETSKSMGGTISKIDVVRKERRPVQKELRADFKKLQEHLLKMCGYYWPNDKVKELLCAVTTVTDITDKLNGKYQICGNRTVIGGNEIPVKGPVFNSEDYEGFEEMKKLFDNIFSEAHSFMLGLKSADTKTVVHDYLLVKKGVTNPEEAYNQMSDDEIAKITQEALMDSGLEVVNEGGEFVVTLKEEAALEAEAETYMTPEPEFESEAVDMDIEFPSAEEESDNVEFEM